MKKTVFLIGLYVAFSSNGFSQSLEDQINAIHNAQEGIKQTKIRQEQELREREEQRRRDAEREATIRRLQAQREEEKREAKREAARKEAQREAEKKEALLRAEKLQEQQKQEKQQERDALYQEQLRNIEIEKLKLDVENKKAEVKRADDFIDQKLHKMSAETDVIQSDADTNRIISTGQQKLLENSSVTIGTPYIKEMKENAAKDKTSLRWDVISFVLIGILALIASFNGYQFYKKKKTLSK